MVVVFMIVILKKLKIEIETNQKKYEDLIDTAAEKISSFVEKAKQENLSQ